MVIKSVSKNKIPNNYRYVIKTQQLENIVSDNEINIHIDLVYWLPQIVGTILEVHFWPPNNRILYNRLYVRAGALLKDDVKYAREKVTEVVLPEFIIWTKKILSLPANSPYLEKQLYFNATINNKILKIIK